MNQQVKISIIDQLQNAERRYYVALHQYSKAAKSSPPELAEQLRKELCDAFEELSAAHGQLTPGCDA
jgi:hypothetical protein